MMIRNAKEGPETMRADRLLQIMLLLQNNGKMTTRELAEALEVSDRTILRDMDALSAAGIPVISERGKTGGWKLIDRFRSSISGLTLDELKSLFILPSGELLEQLGIRPGGPEIRRKLAASMPLAVRSSAQQYLEKIYIDTGTWKPSGGGHTETLRQAMAALWEDRQLRIRYQKAGGETTDRVLCPLGLVAKGSAWYLVAMHADDEYRSYRVSRIVRADILPETFVRPTHFDLAAWWKASKEQFAAGLPRLEVRVLADPSIVGRMTFTERFVEIGEIGGAEEGGRVTAVLFFQTEEEAVRYVLGFGGKMRIISPESLIPLVVQEAKAAIAQHAAVPPSGQERAQSAAVSEAGIYSLRREAGERATPDLFEKR
jgi:predicted DNA-binding transcriptional regulator YafY